MFIIKPVILKGCFEIIPNVFTDERGSFIKIYHNEVFQNFGLRTDFKEEYYSISKPGVLRGMHFQLPPKDHAKLVTCISGSIMDVVVDIRKKSKTYGNHHIFELNEENHKAVYIPSGFAHGFYVTGRKDAVMLYNVTSVYSREHDCGIHWNSIGIPWPDPSPVVSCRDEGLPCLKEYNSVF